MWDHKGELSKKIVNVPTGGEVIHLDIFLLCSDPMWNRLSVFKDDLCCLSVC